jgi:hypothetical protein
MPGRPQFHSPGSYFFANPLIKFIGSFPVRSNEIAHGHIFIKQILEHEIGVISDEKNLLRLLLPGTYVLSTAETTFKGVVDTNKKEQQQFDNAKFFYVEQGYVGLTQKGAFLQQYSPGPHITFDPVETMYVYSVYGYELHICLYPTPTPNPYHTTLTLTPIGPPP